MGSTIKPICSEQYCLMTLLCPPGFCLLIEIKRHIPIFIIISCDICIGTKICLSAVFFLLLLFRFLPTFKAELSDQYNLYFPASTRILQKCGPMFYRRRQTLQVHNPTRNGYHRQQSSQLNQSYYSFQAREQKMKCFKFSSSTAHSITLHCQIKIKINV